MSCFEMKELEYKEIFFFNNFASISVGGEFPVGSDFEQRIEKLEDLTRLKGNDEWVDWSSVAMLLGVCYPTESLWSYWFWGSKIVKRTVGYGNLTWLVQFCPTEHSTILKPQNQSIGSSRHRSLYVALFFDDSCYCRVLVNSFTLRYLSTKINSCLTS